MWLTECADSLKRLRPISRVGQNRIRIYTPYIYGRIFVEASVSVFVSVFV